MRDELRYQYQAEFSLTDEETENMTFHDAYDFADYIYSTRFELLETKYNWNATEIGIVNQTQIPVLVEPFTDHARYLSISKQF